MLLQKLFNPKSVAVIGASQNPLKLGHQVLKNIIDCGYKGKIYPININPEVKEILGYPAFQSVKAVPEKIDLALVIIPAKNTPSVIEECGQKKIPFCIIISSGFKEIGGEGLLLENKIVELAKKYHLRILGPNCLGLINPVIHLNASFALGCPLIGPIAFISQSGAMCTAALDWATSSNLGFSRFISMGNKADISEIELLEFLKDDPYTKVVLAYLESITDGQKFREKAFALTRKKPLIILKPRAENPMVAKALQSHTGALTSSAVIEDALFKQIGAIRANTLEELFDFAEALSSQPPLKGDRIAILTNAGGAGVIAADAVQKNGLKLAQLNNRTVKILKTSLPPAASITNPIDLLGDAQAKHYLIALKALVDDKDVDGIIVLLTPQTATQIKETAESIVTISSIAKKPIVTSFIGGFKVGIGIKILEKNHIPHFEYPERAVMAMKTLLLAHQYRLIKKHFEPIEIDPLVKNRNKKRLQQIPLSPPNTDAILQSYGIPVVKTFLAKNKEELRILTKKIKFPVVLKIFSPDIIHKSDVGGVKVNLKNINEVEKAYDEILKNVRLKKPEANIIGVTLSPMISEGKEIILGMKRDPIYGPAIMFGLGGIYIEVLKDVSFRVAPISREEASEMISEIKSSPLLFGTRGEKPSDIEAIIDLILKLSQLSLDYPQISEIDLNPVKVFEKDKGCLCIDARFVLYQ